MLPTLDARLTAAAELVRPGQPVADIGCDHGKLTAVLAASGKYPKVIGADLRPGPLAKAKQTAGKMQVVWTALSFGSATVFLCCLPGRWAASCWRACRRRPHGRSLRKRRGCPLSGGPRLVMVPATRHSELRRWLWQHGFALVADRPVQAAGRWYAVMAAEYTGEVTEPTFTQCLLGDTARWPEGAGYAAWQRAKLPRMRLGVPDGSPLAAEMDAILKEGN